MNGLGENRKLLHFPGIYTGAVYHDKTLLAGGFPGEGMINGSVIAIKTHYPVKDPKNRKYSRAILLIRSPYDAIPSEFNRRNSKSHVGSATMASYQSGE